MTAQADFEVFFNAKKEGEKQGKGQPVFMYYKNMWPCLNAQKSR